MDKPKKKIIERQDEIVDLIHDSRGDNDYKYGFNDACDEWEKFLPREEQLHLIYYQATGEQISLSIAKGLKAISKRLRGNNGS